MSHIFSNHFRLATHLQPPKLYSSKFQQEPNEAADPHQHSPQRTRQHLGTFETPSHCAAIHKTDTVSREFETQNPCKQRARGPSDDPLPDCASIHGRLRSSNRPPLTSRAHLLSTRSNGLIGLGPSLCRGALGLEVAHWAEEAAPSGATIE